MTFFSWVRYILWMIVVDSSFQYQGPNGSYLTSNGCACPDKEGRLYKLEPLLSKDETRSFTGNGRRYKDYSYSYNPCHPIKLGPENGGCQSKAQVAICKWVPNLKESADTYEPIGHHEGARCGYDDETKTPIVEYEILSPNEFRKSTVRLKCAEGNRDHAIFEIVDEDNWIFELTHFWDVCPSNSDSAITIAAAAVSAVVAVTGLLYLVRYFRKKRNDNNNNADEREHLLGNGGGGQDANVFHNPIGELNPEENRSRPTPILVHRTLKLTSTLLEVLSTVFRLLLFSIIPSIPVTPNIEAL